MRKVFVLDTNILLSDPRSIFKFEDNDVVIPIAVIEEIDHFKKDQSEKGRNAREVSRLLDRMRERGTLSSGVRIFEDRADSGSLCVHLGRDLEDLPEVLANSADNNILAIALTLQKKHADQRKVIIITKDTNLRIKADAFGLSSEDFEADKVDISELYTGVQHIKVPSALINEFYTRQELKMPGVTLCANQFVIVEDEQDENQFVCGVYDFDTQRIKMIESHHDSIWGIFSRNIEQTFGIYALLNDDIRIVTLTGGAGTGKTLLAIAAGLAKTTDEDVYQKMIISRPIFPLGKDIGFLPGDLDEKLNPWMQPVYDSLEFLLAGSTANRQKRMSKSYQELINQGIMSVEPLTYIRGRSLPNAYFVVDEAQNLTPHEIKTIITRAGEGTKIILTGDPFQIDNPYIDSTNNGLTHVVERFKNSRIAAHVTFKQGERSELASLAAEFL